MSENPQADKRTDKGEAPSSEGGPHVRTSERATFLEAIESTNAKEPTKMSRLYDRARWRRRRAAFLAANPLCKFCEAAGRATLANVNPRSIGGGGVLSLIGL